MVSDARVGRVHPLIYSHPITGLKVSGLQLFIPHDKLELSLGKCQLKVCYCVFVLGKYFDARLNVSK